MNGLTPYNIIPQTYWNTYVQQPPVAYYQSYPAVFAAPPTLVPSQTPVNNLPGPVFYTPLGLSRQESNIVYGIAPRPVAPTPIMSPPLPLSQRINNHRNSPILPQHQPVRSSLPSYVKLDLF